MKSQPTSAEVTEFIQAKTSIKYEDETGSYSIIPTVQMQAVTVSPRRLKEDKETDLDWIASFETNLEPCFLGVFEKGDDNEGLLYFASDLQREIIRKKALRVLDRALLEAKRRSRETDEGFSGWTREIAMQ